MEYLQFTPSRGGCRFSPVFVPALSRGRAKNHISNVAVVFSAVDSCDTSVRKDHIHMFQPMFLAATVFACSIALLVPKDASAVTSQPETVQLFENSCAGCHAAGGNVVKRDATLFLSDLKRYGLDDPSELYSMIYSGKGSMPGFGEECQPKGKCTFGRRFSDEQIDHLVRYILDQAADGWSTTSK